MIIGNTDAAAATSTVRSNASGKGSRHHLMSKPSGRKWQASASASKSSDAAASRSCLMLDKSRRLMPMARLQMLDVMAMGFVV
mmetsp:Transcript_15032/g.21357  ORF Transcript_15032/g.21357 Transcript_15032/m.21357 type:complete len:83 (-) Transcript_15032:1146-1394(-)